MWILTVAGIEGEQDKLKWLQPNSNYTFGRADSCDVVITKKFISANHLIFRVGQSQDIQNSSPTPLTVVLESKGTTYIDNVRYRLNETTDSVRPRVFNVKRDNIQFQFKKNEELISVSVNWIPITISYNSQHEMSLRDPQRSIDSLLAETASEFDLRISNGVRSTTDYYLDTPRHNIASLSYSLLHLYPVISEDLLWKLIEDKELTKKDFTLFPNFNDYVPNSDFTINEKRKSLFKGITFVTVDKTSADYYRLVIEIAGGVIKVLPGSNIDNWISFVNKLDKVVIIQFLNTEKIKSLNKDVDPVLLNELCAKLNKKLCRGDDFLQAVVKIDVNILLEGYKRKGDPLEGIIKRQRRAFGSQVKKIDPMSLFLQGNAEKREPQETPVSTVTESLVDEPIVNTKKGRSRVLKIDTTQFFTQLDSNPIIPSQKVLEKTEVVESEPEDNLAKDEPISYDIDVEKLRLEVDAEISKEEKERQSLIPDQVKSSKEFIKAIKKIKTEKKLVQRQLESSIDPGDINIQNLIIVDSINVLETPSANPLIVENNIWDSKWNGRKNFKKFQKVASKSTSKSTRPVLINTMNYLPLEEFNGDKGGDEDQQYFEDLKRRDEEEYQKLFDDEMSQREEVTQFFDDPIKHKNVNSMFVIESDNERETSSFQTFRELSRSKTMSLPSSKEKSHTVNNITMRDESDDDDDTRGPRFRFSRR